jgi:tetratricopeptide (TPR) repeat protein
VPLQAVKEFHMSVNAIISERAHVRCLDLLLAAHRNGDLAALCSRRPQTALWFLRHYAHPMLWEIQCGESASIGAALSLWLEWGLAQIRPDNASLEREIERKAWLGAHAWRPYVALAAHFGFIAVPEMSERYRARKDEPPFERLCGVWNIAPSSFYRYVDRGRRALAKQLFAPLNRNRLASMCDFDARHEQPPMSVRPRELADLSRVGPRFAFHSNHLAPLWAAIRADDAASVMAILMRDVCHLAAYEYIDVLLDRVATMNLSLRAQIDVSLRRAHVCRVQNRIDAEQHFLSVALRAASAFDDKLSLARVYAAQARAVETRDVDRAMVDLRASIELYDALCTTTSDEDESAQVERIAAMIRLAWLYIKRNDPKAQIILEQCEELIDVAAHDLETLASLAQARAELARRSGNLQVAVESNLRALQYFERTSNEAQSLKVTGTIVLLYGELRKLDLAIVYADKIFARAQRQQIEPYTVAATHLNLGIAYFWCERFDDAILAYEHALRIASDANLRPLMGRAHYNLAEAFYRRYQLTKTPADERFGDSHSTLSQAIWEQSNDRAAAEATRNLKRAALGEQEHLIYDRMLPAELAIHFDELHRIQSQRLVFERAKTNEEKALAQLKIAREYVDIVVKERERALALLADTTPSAAITTQLDRITTAFHRSLSHEESLAETWRQRSLGVIASDKLHAVTQHIAQFGVIKKSQYATLCSVSPATASKHLALLATRGLLVRANRGRATAFSVNETRVR